MQATGNVGKKIIQFNPTSKAEAAEACWPGLCLFVRRWRFFSLFAQPIQSDCFHSQKNILSLSDGIISSLSSFPLVVNTTEKNLFPFFSFPLIQFLNTLIKSLLSLLFSTAELKFSQPVIIHHQAVDVNEDLK